MSCGCFDDSCWQDIFKECCPCCCCCKDATAEFLCGSPISQQPDGCSCGSGMRLRDSLLLIPEFDIKMQATDVVCSVPCSGISVKLTSTCCIGCKNGSLWHIGNGVVSGGVSGGNDCGPFTLTINGQAPPISCSDGEGLGVELQPRTDCTIGSCTCCYTTCTGTDNKPCGTTMRMRPLYIYKGGKLILDREAYRQFMSENPKLLNQIKVQPKNRPIIKRNPGPKKWF